MPIYRQLMVDMQQLIYERYCIGDFLMPELQLAEKYQVNRHTVRHALDELVKLGIITRKAGKGTMIISSPIHYPIDGKTRFTSRLEELGYDTSSELLYKQIETVSEEMKDRLLLASDEKVIHFCTVRSVAETPVCMIDHYVSASRFPKVMMRYRNGSLQQFMEKYYQLTFERKVSLISALKTTPNLMQALNISSEIPVLCIKTLNCNANNAEDPVEYSISYNRSDCMQLHIGDSSQITPKVAQL